MLYDIRRRRPSINMSKLSNTRSRSCSRSKYKSRIEYQEILPAVLQSMPKCAVVNTMYVPVMGALLAKQGMSVVTSDFPTGEFLFRTAYTGANALHLNLAYASMSPIRNRQFSLQMLINNSGNCLRVGRECIYSTNASGDSSDSAPDTPPIAETSMMSSLPPAAQQAWVARNLPQGHAVFFLPPHYRDLDSDTISILQQSYEILGERPMPKSCLLTTQRDSMPRYTF